MWMCVVIFFLSYLLTECLDVPVVFLTSCLSSWVVSCCFAFFPWILLISELENQHPKDMLPKNVQNKCFYSCVEHRLKEWWDMKCEFGLCLQLMFEISFQDHRLLDTVWLEYSPRKQKENIASHFPNSVLQTDFANCNVQSWMSAD